MQRSGSSKDSDKDNHSSSPFSRTKGEDSCLLKQINALYLELEHTKQCLVQVRDTNETELQTTKAIINSQSKHIVELERSLEMVHAENEELLRKLSHTETYIRNLPTHQKVTSLENQLQISQTEVEHQKDLSQRLILKNKELQRKLYSLEEELSAVKLTVREQQSELCMLQQTIDSWNLRRELAHRAGSLTIDDVIGQKLMVEKELEDLQSMLTQKEEQYEYQIKELKLEIAEKTITLQEATKGKLEIEDLLRKSEQCRNTLENQLKDQLNINKEKTEEIGSLQKEIDTYKCTKTNWSQNLSRISQMVCKFTVCGSALRNLTNGIDEICQGKDPCPSSLMSKLDATEELEVDWTSDVLISALLDKLINVIKTLEKEINCCQRRVTELYAHYLSSKFEPCCITQ